MKFLHVGNNLDSNVLPSLFHIRRHTLLSTCYRKRHLYNDLGSWYTFHLTKTFHFCTLQTIKRVLFFLHIRTYEQCKENKGLLSSYGIFSTKYIIWLIIKKSPLWVSSIWLISAFFIVKYVNTYVSNTLAIKVLLTCMILISFNCICLIISCLLKKSKRQNYRNLKLMVRTFTHLNYKIQIIKKIFIIIKTFFKLLERKSTW